MLMLILLTHYMFNEFMRYLQDNKWFGSQYNAFQDPLLCLQTKQTGLFNYIVLHCIGRESLGRCHFRFTGLEINKLARGFEFTTGTLPPFIVEARSPFANVKRYSTVYLSLLF